MTHDVTIDWSGECIGVFGKPGERTVVRKTSDGRFAVVNAASKRIVKVFSESLLARRYNASIHGEKLGE